jgi:hypothetical protein
VDGLSERATATPGKNNREHARDKTGDRRTQAAAAYHQRNEANHYFRCTLARLWPKQGTIPPFSGASAELLPDPRLTTRLSAEAGPRYISTRPVDCLQLRWKCSASFT